MKSCEVGCQALYSCAEELLDRGIPVDVVNLEVGERAEPRTDRSVVRTLIRARCDSDLVIPLGPVPDGSALIALEVDKTKGGDELFKLLWKGNPIPRTPIVQSGDGPIYFLMRFSGVPRTNRVNFRTGLALLADGHCIVVPPRDGADRSQGWWKNSEVEVASVPAMLAALL